MVIPLFLFLLPIFLSLQAVGSLFVYPRQLRAMFGNAASLGATVPLGPAARDITAVAPLGAR